VIPVGVDATPDVRRRRGARLVPAALAVLAVLPWAIEHQRDAALADALEQARADAADAARLRRDLARRGGMSALDREKAGQPSVTELLAAVTDLLPDDAWLDGLRIDAGRVQISGYAASAAALIGRFETSDRFTNVRFQTATVRVPERGRERFQLAMDLRRPAGAEAARSTAEARNPSEVRPRSEARSAGP
jgi:Tfp pilus assembly protein PilN